MLRGNTENMGELLSNRKPGKYFDGTLPEGEAQLLLDNFYGEYKPFNLSHAYQTNKILIVLIMGHMKLKAYIPNLEHGTKVLKVACAG